MKPKSLLPWIVMLLLISACSALRSTPTSSPVQPTVSPSQDILDYFPLKRGAYWIYEGDIRWTKINSTEVLDEKITWKMEVERAFQRNNVFGYEMTGAPWDLAWYEAGKERSKYGIVQTGGKFYEVPFETIIRLLNEDDNLFGLVDENDVFLEIPLVAGKKFCDSISITRPDNMYCWNVGKAEPFEAGSVKGVEPSKELWEYPVVSATLPDASRIYFVPGVGISGYSYSHHGTIAEVDVRLVEYHPGE